MIGVTVIVFVVYCRTLFALPVSQDRIFVTEGQSFTFGCGSSNGSIQMINVTLNDGESSSGIVTSLNRSDDGLTLYQYRNTLIEDDGTRIVCTAGRDEGVIHLNVFCK